VNGDIGDKKNEKFICNNCNKEYNSNNGLWKHNKKCIIRINLVKQEKNYNETTDKELIMFLIKENAEIKNLVMEVVKNGIINKNNNNTIMNSNNKTFNLNVFLNETCKDAMNMSEFINSLQIEYDDFH